AIVQAAEDRGLKLAPVADFDAATGKGVFGNIGGQRIWIGNAAFVAEAGADSGPLASAAENLRKDGATVIFVAVDGELAGVIGVADPAKPASAGVIAILRQDGIK